MGKSKKQKPLRIFYTTYMEVIVIDELPADQQKPFNKWLAGQTCPAFEHGVTAGKHLAYASDYFSWYDHWIVGKEAPIYD